MGPCVRRDDRTQLCVFDLDHRCRSAILVEGLQSTSCRGMVDAMFEGFTTFSDRAAWMTR
jgi:hypothetical protein